MRPRQLLPLPQDPGGILPGAFGAQTRSGLALVEVDKWRQEFLKAAEFISPEHHAEVEALVHDLELEFWGR